MNQPSAVKHKLSVIHKKKKPNKRARYNIYQYKVSHVKYNSQWKVFFILCSTNQFETRKKKFHDAGNIPLFFKTNIKYICLKANTFKSLTITNNADAFASSTKGWVQL